MNIPNFLTVVRFCLIPVFVYTYVFQQNVWLALFILIMSGLTDILDGYIARRFNQITRWGMAFDPIADKLTQITTAFCIAYMGEWTMWIAFAFLLVKELLMIIYGIKLYKKKDVVVPANWYGKVATCFFYAVFVILLAGGSMPEIAKEVIVIAAVLFGIFAFVRYAMLFFKIKEKNF